MIDLGAVPVAAEAVVAVVDELRGPFGGVVGDAVVGDHFALHLFQLAQQEHAHAACMASALRR